MNSPISGMIVSLPPRSTGANVYKTGPDGRLKLVDVLKAVGDPGGLCASEESEHSDLQARAAKNYPDNTYLQAEWIRAVAVVRGTKTGRGIDVTPLPPVLERWRR